MKIVFLGTPEIACPFLNRISEGGHSVCGVVSQPDRLQGRGMKLCCPPVKNRAGELSLEIFQPRTHEDLSFALSELKPDLGVVVAYGRKIDAAALSIPRLGFVNVHFSLLPKYRGAAPVQRALINGETVTGVTVFWLDEGMDTGPMFASRVVPVGPDDYAPELFEKTSAAGVELLSECLSSIAAGRILKVPQAGGGATRAPKITSLDTRLNFNGPAAAARNLVRGLAAGPCARFKIPVNGRPSEVQVIRCSIRRSVPAARPGVIIGIEKEKGFCIQCNDGELLLEEVRPEGKKPMSALDFMNGARLKPGDAVL
ncbi:MAG: methionyl-tRNA formyltransferase [Elusimicrobia bacterium RIFOXYA2_FULL_53_38]|nr:MAG: methionyl-tRNA formyltransferase [Elusimicrobia bacterium RIFOXYA2_FULL_53_38]